MYGEGEDRYMGRRKKRRGGEGRVEVCAMIRKGSPKPVAEYFWSWWNDLQTGTPPPNQAPTFYGRWGENPHGTPRTPDQIAAWDAAYIVNGTLNNDLPSQNDVGYTVEMRFDVGVMGFNLTQPAGDSVEWNISVYDCDGYWPQSGTFSANRTWWEDPWGNVGWYGQVRIHCKPSVNVASGPTPVIGP
jgi:hypothetical protein